MGTSHSCGSNTNYSGLSYRSGSGGSYRIWSGLSYTTAPVAAAASPQLCRLAHRNLRETTALEHVQACQSFKIYIGFHFKKEEARLANSSGRKRKSKQTSPTCIFAVRDVVATAKLLSSIFGWKSLHPGSEFQILGTEDDTPMLMLHEFDAHEHKRFKGVHKSTKGIGHSLYVFVDDLNAVYNKVKRRKLKVTEPLFRNENSQAKEFTFQLQEGYHFSVCETDDWLYYWVKNR